MCSFGYCYRPATTRERTFLSDGRIYDEVRCDRCAETSMRVDEFLERRGARIERTPLDDEPLCALAFPRGCEVAICIEVFLIALARLGQVCAEQLGWLRDPATGHWCDGPKEEHRCYIRVGVEPCPCCRRSLLKLSTWQTAIRVLWKQRQIEVIKIERASEAYGMSLESFADFGRILKEPYSQ